MHYEEFDATDYSVVARTAGKLPCLFWKHGSGGERREKADICSALVHVR